MTLDLVNFTVNIDFWLKIALSLVLAFYILYLGLVVRQVSILNKVVRTSGGSILNFLSLANLLVAAFLLVLVLVSFL